MRTSLKTFPFLWLLQCRPPASRNTEGTGDVENFQCFHSGVCMRRKRIYLGKGVPQLGEDLFSFLLGSFQPARELREGKRAAITFSCLPSSAKRQMLTMHIAGLSPTKIKIEFSFQIQRLLALMNKPYKL